MEISKTFEPSIWSSLWSWIVWKDQSGYLVAFITNRLVENSRLLSDYVFTILLVQPRCDDIPGLLYRRATFSGLPLTETYYCLGLYGKGKWFYHLHFFQIQSPNFFLIVKKMKKWLPPVRFELTTPGLQDQCSTTEL